MSRPREPPVVSAKCALRAASRKGFSLVEMLFALGIFSLFVGGMFAIFGRGYQAFHFLSARQSVQGELLRLKAVMGEDFGKTHYRSIGSYQRDLTLGEEEVSRDTVCCLTLDDWANVNNFRDPTSIPLWNRYVVYRTTLDSEGKLERLVVAPEGEVPFRVRSMLNLGSFDDPIVNRKTLSTKIKSFDCRLDGYLQKVVVTLVISDGGGKRGLDSQEAKESFKAEFSWVPYNTVPKL